MGGHTRLRHRGVLLYGGLLGAGLFHLELGLGDLMLATLFPLVMRKAFGRAAGATALTPAPPSYLSWLRSDR